MIALPRHRSAAALRVRMRARLCREPRGRGRAAYREATAGPRASAGASGGGKRRGQRRMQRPGLRARGQRRFRVTTTDRRHSLPLAPNLLDRNFTVATPHTVWAGDIADLPTEEGWLYLGVAID
jgi:putative transposase